MANAQEFLDREASSWEAFEAQVNRVPVDRRDDPGAVETWSVKDVVWHCAYWSRFAADHLVMDGDGPFTDPFDAHDDAYWDGVNAQVAEASHDAGETEEISAAERRALDAISGVLSA